jgi:hypothetical protein
VDRAWFADTSANSLRSRARLVLRPDETATLRDVAANSRDLAAEQRDHAATKEQESRTS